MLSSKKKIILMEISNISKKVSKSQEISKNESKIKQLEYCKTLYCGDLGITLTFLLVL